jgi:hypothetical protein
MTDIDVQSLLAIMQQQPQAQQPQQQPPQNWLQYLTQAMPNAQNNSGRNNMSGLGQGIMQMMGGGAGSAGGAGGAGMLGAM